MFTCCTRAEKIKPQTIVSHIDKMAAKRYGISIERYNRIMALPNMSRENMHIMYENGWDFTDTSQDLLLFAGMQTYGEPKEGSP